MSATTTKGGCQCGAVRYRAEGDIGYPHVCHCRMCQKAAGNYFMPLGGVSRENFALTRGSPSWFQSSHLVRRGFCGQCGTPLFYDSPEAPSINITLGSLDNPAAWPPVMQSNLENRMPWSHLLHDLPIEPPAQDDSREQGIAKSTCQHPDHDTETWPPEG